MLDIEGYRDSSKLELVLQRDDIVELQRCVTRKGYAAGTLLDDEFDYGDGLYTKSVLYTVADMEILSQISQKRFQQFQLRYAILDM